MNDSWEKVKEFHICFDHPTKESPGLLTSERVKKRLIWLREELDEFESAADLAEQVDAMIDLIYFALGSLVEMGVRPEVIFNIVHAANMKKLSPDGKPRYNSDGKTIKPSNWEDPHSEIMAEINYQIQKSLPNTSEL